MWLLMLPYRKVVILREVGPWSLRPPTRHPSARFELRTLLMTSMLWLWTLTLRLPTTCMTFEDPILLLQSEIVTKLTPAGSLTPCTRLFTKIMVLCRIVTSIRLPFVQLWATRLFRWEMTLLTLLRANRIPLTLGRREVTIISLRVHCLYIVARMWIIYLSSVWGKPISLRVTSVGTLLMLYRTVGAGCHLVLIMWSRHVMCAVVAYPKCLLVWILVIYIMVFFGVASITGMLVCLEMGTWVLFSKLDIPPSWLSTFNGYTMLFGVGLLIYRCVNCVLVGTLLCEFVRTCLSLSLVKFRVVVLIKVAILLVVVSLWVWCMTLYFGLMVTGLAISTCFLFNGKWLGMAI